MLSSLPVLHPSSVIDERLQDEQTQLKVQAYTDFLNDMTSGMVPCLFEDYFKDWNELRILREHKKKFSKGVSN